MSQGQNAAIFVTEAQKVKDVFFAKVLVEHAQVIEGFSEFFGRDEFHGKFRVTVFSFDSGIKDVESSRNEGF